MTSSEAVFPILHKPSPMDSKGISSRVNSRMAGSGSVARREWLILPSTHPTKKPRPNSQRLANDLGTEKITHLSEVAAHHTR
jgi:hypothetical protein